MRARIGSSQVSETGEMQKSRMAPLVGVWGTEWKRSHQLRQDNRKRSWFRYSDLAMPQG